MELDSLKNLYIEELKDLYSAEKQLVKALPKMVRAAKHPELKAAFEEHLEQTKGHVDRLEQVCEMLGVSPRGKKCAGMEGLIEEAQELIGEEPEPDVLDAGLISKAQHVEHYEMAGYGTVRTYAKQLRLAKQLELLQETLDEEGETDKKLTELAVTSVNVDAENQFGEQEEEETTSRAGRGSDREVQRGAASEGRGGAKKGGSKSPSRSSTKSRGRAESR
jgi:ferritin-like metal-binding protein YciE